MICSNNVTGWCFKKYTHGAHTRMNILWTRASSHEAVRLTSCCVCACVRERFVHVTSFMSSVAYRERDIGDEPRCHAVSLFVRLSVTLHLGLTVDQRQKVTWGSTTKLRLSVTSPTCWAGFSFVNCPIRSSSPPAEFTHSCTLFFWCLEMPSHPASQ